MSRSRAVVCSTCTRLGSPTASQDAAESRAQHNAEREPLLTTTSFGGWRLEILGAEDQHERGIERHDEVDEIDREGVRDEPRE